MLPLWSNSIARAQAAGEEVVFSSLEATATFSESILFRMHATSSVDIEEAMLYYWPARSIVMGLAYPKVLAQNRNGSLEIFSEWQWELMPGSLPPGSTIHYFWALRDEAGNEYRSEEHIVEYHDARFTWSRHAGGGVEVYTYRGVQGPKLLDSALESLEKLQDEIGVSLEQPVRIFIYANRSDMRLALPSRSERYDEMTTTLGMVVSDDTMLLLGNASNLERTLAHELSHIVVGQATRNPLGGLPRWLDEGLAMYAEGDLPAANRRALDRAIRSDALISVRSLSGYAGDPAQVDLFYAESYSLVNFLLEDYGRDKMHALLDAFKEGAYQEDALREVYGFGLDELDAQWRQYLGLAPRETAIAPPLTTPVPAESRPEESTQPLWPCGAGLLPLAAGLPVVFAMRTRRRPA